MNPCTHKSVNEEIKLSEIAESPDEQEVKADIAETVTDLLKDASASELRKIRDVVQQKTEPKVLMRTAKASVFTDLFSEREYQSALYESLTGEKINEDEFRTITVENYLIGEIHNDLGFLVGNMIIVLCEAQSTWNVNIVYRLLCYLVPGWRRLAQEQGWDAFSKPPIPLPEPKLYVLYTGKEEVPDVLKLSETYFGGRHVPVELEVTCIRDGHNGDILQQYKRFTEIVDETAREHGRTREAAAMIIEQCKKEGVLVAYMAKRGDVEMLDMLSSVFDEEESQRIHINTLIKEERLNTIVENSLDIGADRATIIRQLIRRGHLDEAAAEAFLNSYQSKNAQR